jgi:hypothetical protein
MHSRCVACGVVLATGDGPVHRYLDSAPACWALYGRVLEREYADPVYRGAHRLTVDAYAVQHPGRPSPQTARSAAVHLIRLCLVLEHGRSTAEAVAAIQAAAACRATYHWLEPPAARGARTIADVHGATTPAEHVARVTAWARDVWQAWARHHAQIRDWLPLAARRRA